MTITGVGEDAPVRPTNVPGEMTDRVVRHTDVSRLLGIGGGPVWILAALFVGITAVFVFSTLDAVARPWPSIVALVSLAGGTALLAQPHRDPFPGWWTFGVIASVVVTTVLVSWQLAPSGDIGREAWHLGANTWLLFFVAMRGRIAWSWVAFVAMGAVYVTWAGSVERGPISGALALQTHAGILLVSTLYTIALRRTSQRINALNLRSVNLAAATASADAEHETRRTRVDELAQRATPLLKRVATSLTTSPEDKVEYLLAEATLRDSVRARSLHVPDIADATAAARSRGVEVTLLDDRGQPLPTEGAMRNTTVQVVAALRATPSGRVTVRLAPAGRAVATSIVVESGGHMARVELDENGAPVGERA